MQLYALNDARVLVFARKAKKHQDYSCTECGGIVRLRGGEHRQSHFYHLNPTHHCRQNGKSLTHLAVQNHLLALISAKFCVLEKRFAAINRIADVCWESRKLIFEIQCSPITAEEVRNRNKDYHSLGYTVVWILHEREFNRPVYSAAERYLRDWPIFYTNIDDTGNGCIYDQFDLFVKGFRQAKSFPIPINPGEPKSLPKITHPSNFIQRRMTNWPLHFTNDILDRTAKNDPILDHILHAEASNTPQKKTIHTVHFLKQAINTLIIRPYLILFQFLLEKACK